MSKAKVKETKDKKIFYRAFLSEFETREENGMGIIEGRPVVFGTNSDFGSYFETIDERALDNTDLSDVRLCLNHDTGYVYARSRRNNENSTMQIRKEAGGLFFRAALDIEGSPKAQDYYAAVKRGDMDKMSFMFTIDGYEWENLESDKPTFRITDIGKVFEISCVTFPAYDGTSIEARNDRMMDIIRSSLDKEREKRGLKSVDTDIDQLNLAKARYNYFKNGGKKYET